MKFIPKQLEQEKEPIFLISKLPKGNDLYITLTESKKIFSEDGDGSFEKHKIFLYKEDFEKFKEGLDDVLNKIEELKTAQ